MMAGPVAKILAFGAGFASPWVGAALIGAQSSIASAVLVGAAYTTGIIGISTVAPRFSAGATVGTVTYLLTHLPSTAAARGFGPGKSISGLSGKQLRDSVNRYSMDVLTPGLRFILGAGTNN